MRHSRRAAAARGARSMHGKNGIHLNRCGQTVVHPFDLIQWDIRSVSREAKRGTVLLALVVALASSSRDARADDGPPPSSPQSRFPILVDLGVGTYFPLSFTTEATVEFPLRILVQADIGWMPKPYSDTIVGLLGDFGVLSSVEEQLLKSAIQNSFVGRFSVGWRPFPSLGLEVLGGYTLVTAGGSTSAAQVIDAFLGSRGSKDQLPAVASTTIPLSTMMNAFHVSIGYRFLLLRDHLVLRASLSYLQCFSSSTGVDATPAFSNQQALVSRVNADIQGYLNPYFTQYVKIPVVGLTAAYRF